MELRSVETIVRTLNEANVRYLIVGGLAVNAHGYERLTVDVDLVVGLEQGNILRALRVLQAAGWQIGVPLKAEEFADPARRESLRREKNMMVLPLWSNLDRRTPIDIFVSEPFDFERELARAKWEPIAGDMPAPIVSYETLIAMKKEAGRDKDLLDIEKLSTLDRYR